MQYGFRSYRFSLLRNASRIVIIGIIIGCICLTFVPTMNAPRSLQDVFRSTRGDTKKASKEASFQPSTGSYYRQTSVTLPFVSEMVAVSQARFVVHTGGEGLYIRAEPSKRGQVQAILTDGMWVEQIGPDVVEEGYVWRYVRTQAGSAGWVVATSLQLQP